MVRGSKNRYCSKCRRTEADTTFSPNTKDGGYCASCNRDAVFKAYWNKKLREGGKGAVEQKMLDTIRQLNLLRELLEKKI